MIRLKIPASSANLGSGFDSLALALNLYNYVEIEENDKLDIYSCDGSFVPRSEQNLIYTSAKQVYDICGKSFTSFKIGQKNPIPMSRGLGSSSACIAGGIIGANALLGFPLTQQDILDLACKIETHPDNISATILGGFVVSVLEGDTVCAIKHNVEQDVKFIAMVPNFKLATQKARLVLPEFVPHKTAVYNLSRAALLTAAFCDGRYEFLDIATKDLLHQQYRLPLIEGGKELMTMAKNCGAVSCFISGAGPTILAVVTKSNVDFMRKMQIEIQKDEKTANIDLLNLSVCNSGVQII